MSTSENKIKYPLTISCLDDYIYIVKVSVFDAGTKLIAGNIVDFPFTQDLAKGLYLIRVEISGATRDTYITLDKKLYVQIGISPDTIRDGKIIIEPPAIFSSALFNDPDGGIYHSSHDYYTKKACTYADELTVPGNTILKPFTSLYIFFRYPSIEKYRQYAANTIPSFFKFSLLDATGKLMYSFEEGKNLIADKEVGWAAFNAGLSSGMYFLHYSGEQPRMIPLYVFNGLHTQLFITIGKEPLYGSLRIFLNAEREYDPSDKYNKLIDVLLDKLQNNDLFLNKSLIDSIAYGKYKSPMLGLLGAYIYLRSDETRKNDLFSLIVNNLKNLILKDNDESPDITALLILANFHFDEKFKIPNRAIKGTPMFRIGYEAVKKAAVKNSRLVKNNSLNDLITENIFYDSPFNTFKPVTVKIDEFPESITETHDFLIEKDRENLPIDMDDIIGLDQKDFDEIKSITGGGAFDVEPSHSPEIRPDKELNRLVQIIKEGKKDELLTSRKDEQQNWLAFSIADEVDKNKGITLKQLSEQLQVPGNTLKRIIKGMGKDY